MLAVGVRPNTALAESAGAEVARGITVNRETMETTVPDIFAAGDCVRSFDILDGQEKIIALWPNAVREGKTAAHYMAGVPAPDTGSFAVNAIDFFGLRICTCGLINCDGAQILTRKTETTGRTMIEDIPLTIDFLDRTVGVVGGIHTNKMRSVLIRNDTT